MLTKMKFEFKGREGTGLKVINDMLSKERFADVSLENFEGYLETVHNYYPDGTEKSVFYRYGFDEILFSCEMAEESEGRCFQIASEVIDDGATSEQIFERWKREYPKRRMRSQTQISFSEIKKNASVILYYIDAE